LTHHTEEDRKKNANKSEDEIRAAQDAAAPNPNPDNPSNKENLKQNAPKDNEPNPPDREETQADKRNPDIEEGRKQDAESVKKGKIAATDQK
jgi:hypothetical protein